MSNKLIAREFDIIHVATRKAPPSNLKFSRTVHSRQPMETVHHVQLRVVDRSSDRDYFFVKPALIIRYIHRSFRRPIKVDQPARVMTVKGVFERDHMICLQSLPAAEHLSYTLQLFINIFLLVGYM